MARRYGVETESIDLWLLGGVASLDREPPTPRADGLIAVAGPAVSLLIGVVALGAGIAFESVVFGWVGLVNLLLAVFNMLPGAPLDGGGVLRAWRWAAPATSTGRCATPARRDGCSDGRWPASGGHDAQRHAGHLRRPDRPVHRDERPRRDHGSYVAEQLDGVKVGDLTWFGVAHAGTDMDADSMIWQRQRLGNAGAVAVMGDDGELDGLVLEEQLWAVPSERRAMMMLTN